LQRGVGEELRRKVNFLVLTNDALGLAAGNFHFPIFRWRAESGITESVSSIMRNRTWQLKVRNVRELIGINPEKDYATLHERLSGLPRGYSWKTAHALVLFEDGEELHLLEFARETIHKGYSTEESYQDYILSRIEEIWQMCQEHYKDFPEIEMQRFRPSILVLEKVDGNEELASDIDFLIKIRSKLWSENNPISKAMYEIVWCVERKRGTWEYVPYDRKEA